MSFFKIKLLTIAVLLCSISASAHDFEVNGFYYNITSSTDMTVAVTYKGSDINSAVYSGDVMIPASVSYNGVNYTVTSIGSDAFYGCSSLTSITIPNSVTSIGSDAFYGCSSLTSIGIPESVMSIGENAFPNQLKELVNNVYYVDNWAVGVSDSKLTEYSLRGEIVGLAFGTFQNCLNMESVELTSTIKYIDENAFYGCCDLKNITIPEGVTYIGARAFYDCSGLTSITIPEGVTKIGDFAFWQCSGLTSITIPKGVTYIGYNAFAYCSGLASVVFNCKEIGNWFSDKTSIKSVIIGDSVTNIGDFAFSGFSNLTSVEIPKNVASIGNSAFSKCSRLASITIPGSVTSIGELAFDGCSSLTSVDISEGVTNIGHSAFSYCSSLTSIIIPESVISIDNLAFYGCSSLTSVTINSNCVFDGYELYRDFGRQVKEYSIGGNVSKIGDVAFYGSDSLITVMITADIDSIDYVGFERCPMLKNVILPENLKYIGPSVFANCSNLTSIIIPDSVTSIGNSAFQNCSNLTSIIIPDSVTSIGNSAFQNCSNLTSIIIPDSVTSIGNSAFQNCSCLTSVVIPEGVTNISKSAFENCYNLTSIVIPKNVTSFGSSAFQGCLNLTSVTINSHSVLFKSYDSYSSLASIFGTQVKEYTIGGNVTKIGSNAFNRCDSLLTVNITADITSIGSFAFEGCFKLTDINIPDNVRYIASNAFDGCTNLPIEDYVRYAGKWAIGVTDKTLPRYILRNDTRGLSNTFNGCSSMTRITLPDSLRCVGEKTFNSCSSIKTLVLPCKVSYIGASAFSNCSNLSSLIIPDSVTEIDNSAFYYCTSLKKMDIPDRVKSIGSSAFYYCTSLDSVSLPKELKNIEDKTFYGCNLSTIAIPEKVVEIGTYAFYDNPLTSIIIPDSVMTVGSNAFSNCYNLKTVGIISSDIIANGKYKDVFGGQVTTYILGGGIKTLPDFLFFNYTNLKSVTLPDSLTSIGESAFENCTSLDSIVLPINVSEIGAYAFANCASLKYIACNNPVPPICDMDVFYEVRTDASSLEVLSSVVDVYSKTAPWNDFNIIGVVIPTRMDIIDGEVYDNKKELSMDTITYTRTFNNTEWQALYLPFSMNYTDWSEDFDVAKINDIHQFDEDNDNVLDRTIMEVVKIMGGSLIPNHPYMIRAKSTGTKTITVENATLMPAESNSIDCSSVEREYVFTGTYTGVDGETMVENMYYAMSGGGVKYSANTSVSLKPFRWYMQIKDRKGQVINDIAEAKVIVRGEEDWDVTDIEDVKTESGKFVIYSIGGTLVRNVKADNISQATEGLSAGMYIVNGKKHFIK